MTGQAERSTKNKQPSRSKARGWNSPKEQSNIGTPEAEPSWTSRKLQALEAEPSWTPWHALATPRGMAHHRAILEPTWANVDTWGHLRTDLGPTWANLGPIWANLDQPGPTWANLAPTWGQFGINLGPTWPNMGQHRANLGPT